MVDRIRAVTLENLRILLLQLDSRDILMVKSPDGSLNRLSEFETAMICDIIEDFVKREEEKG